jgi:hypothetical protein
MNVDSLFSLKWLDAATNADRRTIGGTYQIIFDGGRLPGRRRFENFAKDFKP